MLDEMQNCELSTLHRTSHPHAAEYDDDDDSRADMDMDREGSNHHTDIHQNLLVYGVLHVGGILLFLWKEQETHRGGVGICNMPFDMHS